eukprot:2728003-Prymnesium_polylepis.1
MYDDAFACTANTTDMLSCRAGLPFYCTDANSECYGRNGQEVLQTLNARFELLTPDFDWPLALAMLVASACLFKL